jgi:hypothetical protein
MVEVNYQAQKSMKVRELISQLKYIDPDKEVFLGERQKRNKTGAMKTVYGDINIVFHSMTKFGVIDSVILSGQLGSELVINKDK